ncbi:MAG: TIGR04086 family membrane protein [Anaeromicrobium sp.]|jgi:putative membrane protein (TIGR04086 family)|uniref:TIGR04086 family membrane protein n=1 Tax=Anaeromicrobium sp. TaxID=1929132 RepID=UPI0025FFFE00|nr:TIGR04086 family membrane protein [Anaeromicrobium sp.]MCT4595013.1 TIGR04086 family membrane protein [Anaeromicrobium sp.]
MSYKNKMKIGGEKIFWTYVKGIFTACTLMLVMFIFLALLITYTNVSESIIPMASTICLVITAIINGMYVAGKRKKKGWLNGIIAGIIYMLVIIFLSWVFMKEFKLSISILYKSIMVLASSIVGGMIGVNLNK